MGGRRGLYHVGLVVLETQNVYQASPYSAKISMYLILKFKLHELGMVISPRKPVIRTERWEFNESMATERMRKAHNIQDSIFKKTNPIVPLIPALGRQTDWDLCELMDNPVYTVNFRTTRAM